MHTRTDLYNSAYGNYHNDVYADVRAATYGKDFGQTSWVTNEESDEIPELLKLTESSRALELGCGSGRYALHLTQSIHCQVTAVDSNRAAVDNARLLGADFSNLLTIEHCDVSQPLPFENDSFDAVFANDAMCHVRGRAEALGEVCRVLKESGRFLFSDALVIGGEISHEQIASRSAIGYYVFTPPGHNETLLKRAGFRLIEARDTTRSAAQIAERWLHARESRREDLLAVEGEANFAGLQRFLDSVHQLTSQRKLLRFVYIAEKLRS